MNGNKFAARTPEDVSRLVRDHPLAWLVSATGNAPRGSLLPLRPIFVDGQLVGLAGHFARSNPHVELLKHDKHALVLFLGCNGYISPSWMADRTQAPTWNYASSQFLVDIELYEDAAGIEAHLRDLVGAMEAGRPNAWSVDEMGERYRSLARRVIGFTARIRSAEPRFKLGQDERDDVFADILAGLGRDDAAVLAQWMRSFNPGRGRSERT